jgi:hypothetical protein
MNYRIAQVVVVVVVALLHSNETTTDQRTHPQLLSQALRKRHVDRLGVVIS